MLKVVVSKCFTNYTRLWKNKDLFICAFIVLAAFIAPQFEYFFPGGGGLPYKMDGDARRKF